MTTNKFFSLAATAMLIALVLVLTVTGLGYIPVGLFTLTVLTLPVAVGAVALGPTSGVILGLAFGLTSFYTCFTTDILGMKLVDESVVLTGIMCIVPRVLCGLLPALLFRLLRRWDKNDLWAPAVSCAATAICNTLFFLSTMWWFFSDVLLSEEGVPSIWMLFVLFAGINALVEIGVNFFAGGAISKVLLAFKKRMHV